MNGADYSLQNCLKSRYQVTVEFSQSYMGHFRPISIYPQGLKKTRGAGQKNYKL